VHYNPSLINTENILRVSAAGFDALAIDLFRYQYLNNELYHSFCDALHTPVDAVQKLSQIPFLPISFFKTHKVITRPAVQPQLTFESSGTTGETPSRHFVADARIYEQSLLQGFEQYYGPAEDYTILALLPSYLERKNASLVHMAKTLMDKSRQPDNGFYINEWDSLQQVLKKLENAGSKTLLLGVTFALLDFAAACPTPLQHTIVMETGGMKGRREEMTRTAVHELLKQQFGLRHIHSEYGMTELLSQAYAPRNGIFSCTNTMKVLIRDINDPLDVSDHGTGCINVIDLANIYSCSFIATDDIGYLAPNGTFEVRGRLDHSALRGCSLMAV
jgi:hypothetical protein